jgi:hypothetical protein
MATLMSSQRIRRENRRFRGTSGLSENNRGSGFVPAFCDQETGRTELSRLPGGPPAPIHLLGDLPADWVVSLQGCCTFSATRPAPVPVWT